VPLTIQIAPVGFLFDLSFRPFIPSLGSLVRSERSWVQTEFSQCAHQRSPECVVSRETVATLKTK